MAMRVPIRHHLVRQLRQLQPSSKYGIWNLTFRVPAKKSVIHGGKYKIGPGQKYREVRWGKYDILLGCNFDQIIVSGGHLSAQPGANYLTFLSLHPALNHPLFTFFFQVQTQTSSVSYQTIPKCCRKDALNELHKDLIQMQLQRKENIGKHFFLGGGGGSFLKTSLMRYIFFPY